MAPIDRVEPLKDYLSAYVTDEGIDLPRLFNDDFFVATKLLWNAKHYISAAKLLMSAVDTLAFLAFGDVPRNFQKWLETFADLSGLNATADELWELRNSLLHMTNSDSRRVSAGTVRRLTFYVGYLQPGDPTEDGESKFFSLWDFLQIVAQGVARFIESLNSDRSKFPVFVERYDSILSDSRYQIFHQTPEVAPKDS